MTGSDLLVLAPWIVFAVALAAICLLLFRSRHEPRRRPRAFSGPADPADPADQADQADPARPAGRPEQAQAGREPASRAHPQEATCREKNA